MPAPVKWSLADFELVNAESPEGEPWLAAAPGGRFTLTFFESFAGPPAYTDIETRLYRADGTDSGLGPAPTFSSTTIEHQGASAYLPDGRQVFVWTEEPAAGGGNLEDVYASVYVGNLVSIPRFLVAGGAGIQHDPVVAASANGGFAIALADDSVAGGRVTLKFYNNVGTLINTVLDASAPEGVFTPGGSEGDFREVEITALANGNYVVAWRTEANYDVVARIYSPSGVAQTGLIDIDPAGSVQQFPDVTALADGRFLVTYGRLTAGNVTGRIFAADGTSSSGLFTITTDGAPNAQSAQSAALHDGRFVTVWRDATGNIEGQVMFADGTPDGAAFAVNSDAAGDKGRPTVATLADGRFAVSWESGAGATATIFTTIFEPREIGLNNRSASSFNDDWFGTDFADRVYLGTGNDTMNGDLGNDTLYGEAGLDTLLGAEGNDKVYGGNDGDTLDGGADDDTVNGELGNDILTGVAGSDTLNGGDGNDEMFGGSEGDILNGNNGNDELFGESGQDVIKGGNGDDIIDGGADKDTLDGDANNDTLIGGDTGDTLRGGTGNDRQLGGLGGDVHLGGSGLDVFVFTDDTEGNDRIDDWVALDDQLEIDASNFGGGLAAGALAANRLVVGSAPVATQAFGQFLYNTTNGQLSWDDDGTGATAAVAITRLLNGGLAVNTLAVGDFDIVT